MDNHAKIAGLEAALADLKKRWPAHSVKPELINEMERLEEELARLKTNRAEVDEIMSTVNIQVLGSRVLDQCYSGG